MNFPRTLSYTATHLSFFLQNLDDQSTILRNTLERLVNLARDDMIAVVQKRGKKCAIEAYLHHVEHIRSGDNLLLIVIVTIEIILES